jgi:hypothetical protein
MRPPPEDAVAVDFVGRSPGSRVIACLGLPGVPWLQWHVEEGSPLTVAGAAAASGKSPHRVPFCVPRGAGTDIADYSWGGADRKRGEFHLCTVS